MQRLSVIRYILSTQSVASNEMSLKNALQKLLIVEDDPALQSQLKWCFEDYDVVIASERETAIAEMRRHSPAVVLQDLGLPPDAEGVSEGMATLQEIVSLSPHTKVIVVTGNGDQNNAVRAIGLGAYDFYEKPVRTDVLRLLVDRAFHVHALETENRRLMKLEDDSPLDGIIAVSEGMLQVCRMISKVAPADVTVLLLGESGTGKELLSRALHSLSNRRDQGFVAINCAAIPENLLESELFGHEKGAFTGAVKTTPGKFELANNGTLLLDEIGDMPLALQAKLLRFLQERVVERVGGREEIAVDVRVVCATNQNISNLVAEGRFREDLFYRISEITVNIPPLRERDGGKLVLARALLAKFAEQHKRSFRGFSADAQAAIENHKWPGNVRELENKIKGAVIMSEGNQITAADLGLTEGEGAATMALNLTEVRRAAETKAIRSALIHTYGNAKHAAKFLGITLTVLRELMDQYGLCADAFKGAPATQPGNAS
jgi:two-component system, NtrC family, response regulator